MKTLLCRPVLALSFLLVIAMLPSGCGSGSSTTVIQPGEDYQLTDQEQKNKELEEELRKSAGRD